MTRAWVALAGTLLVTLVGSAHAFELLRVNHDPCARGDKNLSWTNASVAVGVSGLESPYDDLVIEAWDRWNMSLRRFRFRSGNGAPCTRDGVATVSVADQPCGLADFGDALAITRSVWNLDGTLVDADVTFQDDTFLFDPDKNGLFRQVAMHELGHVLGLDHSDACGASGEGTLMRTVLALPRLEAPQADDVSGAEAIYPSGGGGGDGTVPDGANSCAIAPAAEPTALWLLIGLVPLVVGARSRAGN